MSKYSWFVLFHTQSDAHPSLGVLAIPQSLFSGCPSVVTFHLCCSVELFYTSFVQGVWLWYRSSHEHSPIPSRPLLPLTRHAGWGGHTGTDMWTGRLGILDSSPGLCCLVMELLLAHHVCSFQHLAQLLGPISCLLLSLVHCLPSFTPPPYPSWV